MWPQHQIGESCRCKYGLWMWPPFPVQNKRHRTDARDQLHKLRYSGSHELEWKKENVSDSQMRDGFFALWQKGATKIQIYHTNKGRKTAPERRLWTRQDYYFLRHRRKRRENTINQVSCKIRITPVISVSCWTEIIINTEPSTSITSLEDQTGSTQKRRV